MSGFRDHDRIFRKDRMAIDANCVALVPAPAVETEPSFQIVGACRLVKVVQLVKVAVGEGGSW